MKTQKKTSIKLAAMSTLILLCLSPLSAQSKSTKLAHQTDDKNAPVVYFTRDVSAAGLMKVYNALNQKKQGKVGIKVSFGAPDEDVLNPELLTNLIKATDGTMLDSCGLSGNRWTPELNLSHARKHGFDKVGPMQMLDENDDIDMPVKNGYLLKYARTGSHFDEYDTLISVFKFRMHFLPALDGAIKNVTLCLGSRSGKCLIHSGGTDPNHYHDTKPDVLEKSFADALRATLDYKDNWAFINVIDSYEPEDSCKGTKNTGNIGIIASYDPVAIDQCSVDFVAETAETAELRAQWEETHQVKVLEYAEKLGCGKRNYRLVEIK
jgi:uncharacterized Fe-S center protein